MTTRAPSDQSPSETGGTRAPAAGTAAPTSSAAGPAAASTPGLRATTAEFLKIEAKIKLGGGKGAIDRQHEKGRLTARERIERLLDPGAFFAEFGLWSAYGMYAEHGGAPAAGVVTGVGKVQGHDCMIIANDATVKAGAFFPMTCKKIIRAQHIAMMARLPLIYLVDSAGVFLPMQEDVFPDTDDFGRIFRNNAVISADGIPQIAAIMGYCVAGGGYLPVLCDTLLMTEGSGLYLAGPALVKAAIGQVVSDEELGGAKMHAGISGTIDFREKDDESCLRRVRELMAKYPPAAGIAHATLLSRMIAYAYPHPTGEREEFFQRAARRLAASDDAPANLKEALAGEVAEEYLSEQVFSDLHILETEVRIRDRAHAKAIYEEFAGSPAVRARALSPINSTDRIYEAFTDKAGSQYDVRDIITAIVDARAIPNADGHSSLAADFDEYKAEYGPSVVCGYAKIGGQPCGIVANQKKLTRTAAGAVQLPGVIYHDSADKAARFIMDCNQRKIPLVFLHDTTGFMVGKESEQHGIIRAGAKMVNAMSNSIVPKIVVVMGGSYGAGNYAMCGRAFDPFITYAWPGSKCAVMGAAQATGVLAMIEEKSRERKGEKIDEETHKAILDAVRASYNEQQDIRHGAARGWVDRIIEPHKTRDELIAALGMTSGWDYGRAFKTGVLQT